MVFLADGPTAMPPSNGHRVQDDPCPKKTKRRQGLQRSATISVSSFRRLLDTFNQTKQAEKLNRTMSPVPTVETGQPVQIIRSLADLEPSLKEIEIKPPDFGSKNLTSSLSLEDIRLWNSRVLSGPQTCFAAGPNKSTTNVAWLVGGVGSHHIDILEDPQPPSHLNVKDHNDMETGTEVDHPQSHESNQRAYTLSRSKSVCDIQGMNTSMSSISTSTRSLKRDKSTQSKGKIVRNRTILGSFPLFYKLSQSLSSLNTKTSLDEAEMSSVYSHGVLGTLDSSSVYSDSIVKTVTFDLPQHCQELNESRNER